MQIEIKANVKGRCKGKFKGFLIRAVDDSNKSVGTFQILDTGMAKCVNCDKNDATCDSITHANNNRKMLVEATWTPPNDFTGTVFFRYTLVQSFTTYWVKVDGPTVTVT